MKTKIIIITFFLSGIILTSCSNRLIGTWTIQKYETTLPEQKAVSLNNIGSMTFNKNGSGEKNISYTLFGVLKEDNIRFNWSMNNKNITIESKGSDFAKTWFIVSDKNKFQKWQTTDGNTQIEILELTK